MMKIKKFLSATVCLCLLLALPLSASAQSGAIHWYLKRNGNSQPILPDSLRVIEGHDVYYMNTALQDQSEEKKLYLTFDAGYENGNVEKILNVLRDEQVPAAFFVLDHIILKNTDLVRRMANEGHLVCNHTKNHKDLTQCDKAYMKENLTDLEKIYEEKTGQKMAKYFRFPEGCFSAETLSVADEMGYKTVFWSLAYADWDNDRQPPADKAKELLLSNTHNGAVILLHPNSATNAAIMKDLIHKWREMGYTFGTLDELCASVKK